ncbi:MAG TPA: hypothetical protein VLC06_21410 [Polyangia bacterium]|nr:hypothetical protein [Polyangia bacterium]
MPKLYLGALVPLSKVTAQQPAHLSLQRRRAMVGSFVPVMVLACLLERSLAAVREVSLMSLEASADVPMSSLGILTEPISVGCAGYVHVRGISSALGWGRSGRPRLGVPDCRRGKNTERHKTNDLTDHALDLRA